MAAVEETPRDEAKFDFSSYPHDTLFYDRRETLDRRADGAHAPPGPAVILPPSPPAPQAPERRAKRERRRRIDPTTFEKQYTDDELEFMNAMQKFKVQTGKPFPNHGEVLRVALALGYRRLVIDDEDDESADEPTMM